jgi:biotin carboxyl carrier protein
MSTEARDTRQQAETRPPSTGDLLDQLTHFAGPPEQFLPFLLAVQCRIAAVDGGAILRATTQGAPQLVAVWPPIEPDAPAPVWLARAAESAGGVLAAARPAVLPIHTSKDLYGEPARRHVIALPLRSGGAVRAVAAYLAADADPQGLAARQQRLELTTSLLSLYEMRQTLQRRQADLHRLREALETLAAVNEQKRFVGAAMAFCNEIASRWHCERVCIGFLQGRYVACRAMSRTEKFSRKMKVVQDIEAAMEECVDQDVEITHPAPPQATYISRVTRELATRHGPTAVLSLPLRHDGDPVGALTCERPADRPFDPADPETLRLTCDLCTPRLVERRQQDRWFGARAASAVGKGLGKLVGPRHAWLKVAALAILAGVLFLIFAQGDYCAEGEFILEASQRRVVPAPFDGYLARVHVEPGSKVVANETALTELDTSDLRAQRASAVSQRERFTTEASIARSQGKTAEAQIADAQARGAAADIELLDLQIAKATIRAPISGEVVAGDLKHQIGAPVKTGDALFEIAPVESLYADVSIPEDQIPEVRVGQRGELSSPSYPARRIGFTVTRIDPVAEVVEEQNVFKVRVKLDDRPEWFKPRMTGSARIFIDKRSYGWLLTHKLVDWIRMKLWL